jgi:hypothetical protein
MEPFGNNVAILKRNAMWSSDAIERNHFVNNIFAPVSSNCFPYFVLRGQVRQVESAVQ